MRRFSKLVAATACAGALACQALYGDFRIDASEVGSGATSPGACERGQTRCDGARLESCAVDRSGWTLLETCGSAALCNVGTDSCRPCTPGEVECSDGELRRCTDAREWDVTRCATAALCSVADDRRSGQCAEPACDAPGRHRCVGPNLERCAPGLDRWEPIEICASDALCDAADADARAAAGEPVACRQGVCSTGQFACDGAELTRCDPSLEGWDPVTTCDSAELCNAISGDCSACTPGDHACSGAELVRCAEAGGFERVSVCAAVGLCNAAMQRCDPPSCDTPGRVRCRDTLELEVCPSDLVWSRLALCASVALCDVGERRCEPPACRPGARRCRGATFERCRDDLSGWEASETCGAGETCDPTDGCVSGACADGALRCNDRYLEACADGAWEAQERCATEGLCDAAAGACQIPVCGTPLPEFNCSGQSLQACSAGRDGFEEIDFCVGGMVCNAAAGRCE